MQKELLISLVGELKRGNERAFEQLYNALAPKMKAVAFRYVNDQTIAEDILHDAFIKANQQVKKLKVDELFEGWLRRIVVNESLDYLSKEKKFKNTLKDYAYLGEDIEEEESEPLGNGISALQLMQALDKLPEGYKVIFNLYVIDGFKHHEIAAQLNITEGTSKSQLSKAKNFLRKLLSVQGQLQTN